jgi:hypothetical protein
MDNFFTTTRANFAYHGIELNMGIHFYMFSVVHFSYHMDQTRERTLERYGQKYPNGKKKKMYALLTKSTVDLSLVALVKCTVNTGVIDTKFYLGSPFTPL